MTEPERPADAPSGSPSPEEISARLEALLKRTHAMRAEKAAGTTPHSVTWPPSERELDHYDVVDVADRERPAPPSVAAAAVPAAAAAPPRDATVPASEFARPDWSELRLRGSADEVQRGSRWLPLLVVLLAVATLGQAAYIWYLRGAGSPDATGRLRVDGPDGAQIRVDGQAIGTAPLDHALPPGDYDIQVVQDGTAARTQRVNIALGHTVVLLPLAGGSVAPAPTAAGQPPPVATTGAPPLAAQSAARPSPAPVTGGSAAGGPGRTAAPSGAPPAGSPAAALGPAGVSATRGAVVIESTPPGLPVTMEGRERGVTPITIGQLKPGRHDVLVGGLARQVDVSANQVSTLRVSRP